MDSILFIFRTKYNCHLYNNNYSYMKSKLQITVCIGARIHIYIYNYMMNNNKQWKVHHNRFADYDTNRVIIKRYVVFCNSSLGGQTSMFTLRGRIIITEEGERISALLPGNKGLYSVNGSANSFRLVHGGCNSE